MAHCVQKGPVMLRILLVSLVLATPYVLALQLRSGVPSKKIITGDELHSEATSDVGAPRQSRMEKRGARAMRPPTVETPASVYAANKDAVSAYDILMKDESKRRTADLVGKLAKDRRNPDMLETRPTRGAEEKEFLDLARNDRIMERVRANPQLKYAVRGRKSAPRTPVTRIEHVSLVDPRG